MELAAVGHPPAGYGHQVMRLWSILCERVSMHLGIGPLSLRDSLYFPGAIILGTVRPLV